MQTSRNVKLYANSTPQKEERSTIQNTPKCSQTCIQIPPTISRPSVPLKSWCHALEHKEGRNASPDAPLVVPASTSGIGQSGDVAYSIHEEEIKALQ